MVVSLVWSMQLIRSCSLIHFFFYFAVPLILLKVCPNVFLINHTQNTSIKTTVMFSFLGGGKKNQVLESNFHVLLNYKDIMHYFSVSTRDRRTAIFIAC